MTFETLIKKGDTVEGYTNARARVTGEVTKVSVNRQGVEVLNIKGRPGQYKAESFRLTTDIIKGNPNDN